MDPVIYLSIALHNHQPVGQFPHVLNEIYSTCYLPLLEVVDQHPAVPLTLHYSGPLLDWLQQERPDFLQRLRALVRRGQVELMTGGYYEPILPMIPDEDKVGQIRKMSTFLRQHLGAEPVGLWLAERVWEPSLPAVLHDCGVRYTMVDDAHFEMVGLSGRQLRGYYVTEEQGKPLCLFSSSKALRYAIPWAPVEEVIELLQEWAACGSGDLALFGDDGEKFGAWPGTYKLCFEKGWLARFFSALEANSHWLKVVTLRRYLETHPPLGTTYLPTASYPEMMDWALPSDVSAQLVDLRERMKRTGLEEALPFLHGGFWRNFLVKYPEVNLMHKKMLLVHRKVHRLAPGDVKEEALTELWRGQGNCPYWHGVFGGVYLNDMRAAVFRHLITAEVLADAQAGQCSPIEWALDDIDLDGRAELLLSTRQQNLYFDLADGGTLVEWDDRVHKHNLVSCLARRFEPYHASLAAVLPAAAPAQGDAENIHLAVRSKEAGLDRLLVYDRHLRTCLRDHLLLTETTLAEMVTCSYHELGDFATEAYELESASKDGRPLFRLRRLGYLLRECEHQPLELTKELALQSERPQASVRYLLHNPGGEKLAFLLGCEWNLNLLAGGHNPNAFLSVGGASPGRWAGDSSFELSRVTSLEAGNRWLGSAAFFKASREATLWTFPVESVSSSEAGVEKTYQCTCLVFLWPVVLEAGDCWEVVLEFGLLEEPLS